MKVNLDLSETWFKLIDPAKVEKKYNVKFVCETPIRYKNSWRDYSSLIFYGEKHPEGSNYMALSVTFDIDGNFDDIVITDGISATEGEFTGLIDGDEVYYSRFRHDYRMTPSGEFIDGGRDYTRTSVINPDRFVTMKIIDGKLEIVNE